MSSSLLPEEARGTILLVDDEAEILTALQDLLEDEYEVLATTSPFDALTLLERGQTVSVILSDQRMPGLTGDAFLARARDLTRAEALMLTGYADLEAVVAALNHGRIAGYSAKPWDPPALRAMVASAYSRWQLTRALETEQALLRGLLDNSADALSFKDAQGRFVRLNAHKAAELGTEVAQALGRREAAFLAPEAAAALALAEAAAMNSGTAQETLEERPGSDGQPRWWQVSRTPIRPGSGAPEFLVSVEREVTESRRLEARLRQADKMQALGTMAGGIAHDFNNLLTAILGSLHLAARHAGDPVRLDRMLRNATLAAERGSALTQRLLSFSRQRDLAMRAVDMNQLVAGMDDLVTRSLGGTVQVRHAPAPELWPATVDPGQLELALLNLCINARDAMPGGGTLTLATRNARLEAEEGELAAGDYAVLSVCDTGTGMTPEVLARVFEPFFTTKEVGKGTGLGLSMVYGLCRQAGGAVRVRSTPGEGTCVEMFLPRSAAPAEAVDDGSQAATPDDARAGCILVVDDDPTVREVTLGFLNDLGHRTRGAENGTVALNLLRSDPTIDLMVADLAMPEMTGAELAVQARQLRPQLPVLLVTGYAEQDKIPRDHPVLQKPFQQDDLARSVAELLVAARR
ncbi:response regulator [Roseomonas sp. BN140053]|uniref:response regulator n=1 Tax=Roseomonas sp. BN140053 TaxID=3391898 RepID=UPI0039E91BD1